MKRTTNSRIPFNLMTALIFMSIQIDIPDTIRMNICVFLLCYLSDEYSPLNTNGE
jgi:hypothetical protein